MGRTLVWQVLSSEKEPGRTLIRNLGSEFGERNGRNPVWQVRSSERNLFFFFFFFFSFFLFFFFFIFLLLFFFFFVFFFFFYLFFFSPNSEPAKPWFSPVLTLNSEPAKPRFGAVFSPSSEPVSVWSFREKELAFLQTLNLPNQDLAWSFLRTANVSEIGVRRKERA